MAMRSVGCSGFEPRVEAHAQRGELDVPARLLVTSPEVHPGDVLADLCVLLEEYAPTWYGEQLRHRVLTALRLPTEVLVELCALLEDYAPTWYTGRPRGRALGALKALGLLESGETEDRDTSNKNNAEI